MRFLILISLLLALTSCATEGPLKRKLYRSPGGVGAGEILKLSYQNLEELKEDEFLDFVKTAQEQGFRKVIFGPETDPYVKASMTEATAISGDFYLLVGVNFSETDESIRKADYNILYSTARRMSWLKFRVIINLVASVEDLKSALSNKRPTIIVWSSHGNTEAFYDFNQMPIPADIFKNASPSVYQFHLSACYGFHSLQEKYRPFIPNTIKHWSWKGLTSSDDLQAHLDGSEFNPFYNYPGTFTYKNLQCRKKGERYIPYDLKKKTDVGDTTYDNLESCHYTVANSNDHFICNLNGNEWEVFDRRTMEGIPHVLFDKKYDCASRISNIHKNKICLRFKDTDVFHYLNVKTGKRSEETFKTPVECYNHVQTTTDI